MNQYVVLILTSTVISTVISTLITALISFFTLQKNSKLKYITNERSAWREQIRNIMVEIDSASEYNIDYTITKLKSRINAYGYKETDDVMHDGHIWQTINCIKNHNSNFRELKTELILYLSFLLKYDWERSKKEVFGNTLIILSIGTALFYFVYYCFNHSLSYVYLGIVIVCPLFISVPFGAVKLGFQWKMDNKNKSIFYVVGIFVLAAIECIFFYVIFKHLNKDVIENTLLIYSTILLFFASIVEEKPKLKYVSYIRQLKNNITEK